MKNLIFIAFLIFTLGACKGEKNPRTSHNSSRVSLEENTPSQEKPAASSPVDQIATQSTNSPIEDTQSHNPENNKVKVNHPVKKEVEEISHSTSSKTVTSHSPEISGETTTNTNNPSPPQATENSTLSNASDLHDPTPERVNQVQSKSSDVKPETKPSKPAKVDKFSGPPRHTIFSEILSATVSSTGEVDYRKLKSMEDKLDKYLKIISEAKIDASWTREQKLAFWINAYNAFTIKLILDHYPVKSITDILNGKPWDKKWIHIDGKTLSLNDIENGIIRPQFNEPRIHFAVNCAAQSCPPLANKAFTSKNLESMLEKRTKAFINNPKYNHLSKNKIKISKIFDWYKDDFGNVGAFVSRYADTTVKPTAKISYQEYNWQLNGK